MLSGAHATIVAIASPPGPGLRGIVRISGPEAGALVAACTLDLRPAFSRAAPRGVFRGRLDDGGGTQPVRLLWMPGPRSYTREDVAELHLPGAEPLLARALARLLALGARAARPGEFTRRAFLNGRLDLSRAEGVLALTEASNEAELRAAAGLLEGGLEERAAAIRARLLELAALCEASLDFEESETGHVPRAELLRHLEGAQQALEEASSYELARSPPSALPRVLLCGAPNAGKSSLWNALTGGRALVSAHPGTTRDALMGAWDLGPFECLLVDGPGLEEAAAGPDRRAQELFARERRGADAEIWVVDASGRDPLPSGARLVAWNKIDLEGARPAPERAPLGLVVPVSARGGAGLVELARATVAHLGGRVSGGLSRGLLQRHREALRRSLLALGEVREELGSGAPLDLVAEALRAALGALDEISGRTVPEDVLDEIFARFCLGK